MHDLGSILGCLSLHGVMTQVLWLQGVNITAPARIDENVSTPHLTSRSRPEASQSKLVHNRAWFQDSLKDSLVSYEGLHVLSMFLFNTNLHVTQAHLFFIQIQVFQKTPLQYFKEDGVVSLRNCCNFPICADKMYCIILFLGSIMYVHNINLKSH